MAVETWDQLPKNQTDPELIAEAIARLIAVHEADPNAHAGAGESLEVHRQTDVLDHPAGSVLADKYTLTEVDVYTDFGSLSGWVTSGDLDNSFWPGIRLGSNYPVTTGTRLVSQEGFCEQVFDLSKDFLIEFGGTISDSNYATYFVGLSNADYPASGNTCVGFKLVNGSMRGIFGKGATFYQTDVIGVDVSEPHTYRAQYNAGEKVIYFYCDGELINSYDLSALSGTATCYFRLNLKESAENYVTAYIYYFRVSRQN